MAANTGTNCRGGLLPTNVSSASGSEGGTETLTIAALKEVPKLVSALVGLGLVWFVGQRLTVFWNLRQKQRENDLATARDFHSLYGEFFAIWKLWDYYVEYRKSKSLPEVSQWSLLERACVAEGKLESTLVRLVSERDLTASEIALLAQFRQLYQILRESYRTGPTSRLALFGPSMLYRVQETRP